MMASVAVWLRVRAGLRSEWRTLIVLTLVVAVGGGCVLTAVAGARRTETAMQRFLTYNRPSDVSLFFGPDPSVEQKILSLPQVESTTRLPYLMADTDGSMASDTALFGAVNDAALHSMDRPQLLAGRLPDPNRADEVVIDDRALEGSQMRIGSSVTVREFTPQQVQEISENGFRGASAQGPRDTFHVVGVIREPTDIAVVPIHQHSVYDSSGSMYATPAFVRKYAANIGMPADQVPGAEIVQVKLRHGAADVHAFATKVNQLAPGQAQLLIGSDAQQTASTVQRALDVESFALWVFAALAALATIVLVSVSFARMVDSDSGQLGELRALGMTRRELVAVAMARPVAIAVIGGLLAVLIAIAASPLTPIGIARQAEIAPGVSVNVAALLGGFAALVVVLVLGAFLISWRATRSRPQSVAHAPDATRVSRLVANPRIRLGVAVTGLNESAPGRRVAVTSIVLATAAVVAAGIFGTSLTRLADSPRQQGWTFDVVVGNTNDQTDQIAHDVPLLRNNRYVGDYAAISTPPDTPTINGQAIPIVGVKQEVGHLGPPVLDGRFVQSADEIALGSRTLRQLHAHVGDRVVVSAGNRRVSMRVTGVVMGLSAGAAFNGRLDQGGVVTLAGMKRIEPDAFVTIFFVRFKPGVDQRAALASLRTVFRSDVLQHVPAQDVKNLTDINSLPRLLALLVILAALATVTSNLYAVVRRRGRSLATLKAMGMRRRHVAATVFMQTWVLTIVGIVIGVPIGVLFGRWAWRYVASQIGSVQPPVITALVIGIAVVGALVGTTVTAVLPALKAAWIRPATALRDG
jgi:ABC-type lipoprotein release transport system permease subunit